MGVRVVRKAVKTAMGKSNLPGIDYTVNPYIGCSHGCIYCYARLYCPKEVAESWGRLIFVKENLPQALLKDVRGFKKGKVMLSTITDPYQPQEKKFELTRRALSILLNSGFKVSIQTKSNLVLRDIDLLLCGKADVGFSLSTLDSSISKKIEPKAPSPEKRIDALRRLNSEGVKTWIFLAPVLPNTLNGIEEIAEVAKETESTLYFDRFRIKAFMKEGRLRELVESVKNTDWKAVERKIHEVCERKGVVLRPAFGNFWL